MLQTGCYQMLIESQEGNISRVKVSLRSFCSEECGHVWFTGARNMECMVVRGTVWSLLGLLYL